MRRYDDFREALCRGPMLADGAMGTMLRQRKWKGVAEVAVLKAADIVMAIHKEYVDADAQLILTNSFRANAWDLALGKVDPRHAEDINSQAVKLAREVAEARGVFVGGSVGPLSRDESSDDCEYYLDNREKVLAQQIDALVDSGVDVLVFETMPDIENAMLVLKAGARHKVPKILMLDSSCAQPLAEMLGCAKLVDIFGFNCGAGPHQAQGLIDRLLTIDNFDTLVQREKLHLAVKPNAGDPYLGEVSIYPIDPKKFGDFARSAAHAGVTLIGGCCGTTPDHIREASRRIRSPESRTNVAA